MIADAATPFDDTRKREKERDALRETTTTYASNLSS